MKQIILLSRYLIVLAMPIGCGVKGNPQPPLTPPVLGRGSPQFVSPQAQPRKKSPKNPDEWDEADDFEEEQKKR